MGDIINYYLTVEDQVRASAKTFAQWGKWFGGYNVFADGTSTFADSVDIDRLAKVFKEELIKELGDGREVVLQDPMANIKG